MTKKTTKAAAPARRAQPGAVGKAGAVARNDGWGNIISGLGVSTKDKLTGSTVSWAPMAESDAEHMYAACDVSAAVVDTLPEDALRQWLRFDFEDQDLAKATEEALDGLGFASALEKAWKWARLYGGAAILMNVDDSQDLAQPLKPAGVRQLKSFIVLSRHELLPADVDEDIQSPLYGRPLTYRLQSRRSGAGARQMPLIHHTRLLRFDGVELPMRLAMRNQLWGDTVLRRAYNAIRNYQVSNDAAAAVLQEFNQGVFKMRGLADLLLASEDDAVLKRLQTVKLAQSVCRAVVIDQDEEYTTVGAAVAGVPDMLKMVGERLVVASKMPHTKILGQSPKGLGSTGENENRDWYDYVGGQQDAVLRSPIQRVLTVLLSSRQGPASGKAPKVWAFEFNPLWQASEKEQAETRKAQMETDVGYVDAGVLDASEVTESRFGSGRYSTQTTLDKKIRERTAPDKPTEPPPADKKGVKV